MNCKSGHFIGHTADVNLDIGFVPDVFMYFEMEDTTNPNIVIWFDEMANNEAAGDKEGIIIDGSASTVAYNTDSQGITKYDTATMEALLPAPDGDGESPAAIYGDFAAAKAANLDPVERTVAILGTVIRPTVANGRLYECTVSGGVMGALTEPTTWPILVGDTVSDGSNTWTCREENLKRIGHKGVTIAAEIQTNGTYNYWIAFKSVQHKDGGDAANW